MFYLQCASLDERTRLIDYLKKGEVHSVFHYLSLHKSPYYTSKHGDKSLPHSDIYTDTLLRLPFYYELEQNDVERINNLVISFYNELEPG